MNDKNKISVLFVQPKKYPKVIEIDNTLEAMQKLVEGNIEEYMPFDDDIAIICNDEGKIAGLQPNRAIYDSDKNIADIICGNFFVAYAPIDSENFQSLPKNLLDKYNEMFKHPQRFIMTTQGVKAIPFRPLQLEKER